MNDDGDVRDDELGAALRQLPVPPPREDFYPRLLSRLEEEAGTRAPSRRRWQPQSPLWLGAAAAVLVVVMLVSWVGLPGRGLGPRRAEAVTADEVRKRVDDALASLRTLQGDITVDQHVQYPDSPIRAGRQRHSFVLTSAGDFRIDGLDDGRVTAYSATRGAQRTFGPPASGTLAADVTGLAPGPPDPAPIATVLSRSVGSLVRAFLDTDADVPVTENEFEGRGGWHLVVPLTSGGRTVAELEVTVDRETGVPLYLAETDIGTEGQRLLVREVRVGNLRVDAQVSAETFSPPFPAGTPAPAPVDRGYRRVEQREVTVAVGYQPLVPETVPGGFKLTEIAVARDGAATAAGNPPSRNVVSMAWQRGFDRFVVTTRETGADRGRWTDPFLTLNSRLGGTVEPVTIASGAAAGGRGEVVTVARDVPHAWVVTDRLVVTVSGDLTSEQMHDVLRSLRAAG